MPPPGNLYSEKLNFFKEKQIEIKGHLVVFAILRLSMFVVFLLAFYFVLNSSSEITYKVASASSLILFIWAVRHSVNLKEKLNLTDEMVFINSNELNILANKPNAFDNGTRFSEKSGFTDDLDLFGKNSLYQLLNRTTTSHGADYLAGLLTNPLRDNGTILSQQEAIRKFAPQLDIRQSITANGLLNRDEKENLQSIYSWLNLSGLLYGRRWLQAIRFVVPVFNLLCLYYYLITDNYFPLVAGIFISWIIIGYYGRYINRQHILLSKKQSVLDRYAGILEIYGTAQTYDSTLLQNLSVEASAAGRSIKKLSKLAGLFDQRMNILVNFFMNSFLLYDIHCMIALEKWKAARKQDFSGWIEVVGHIECLNSLATFHFNNPDFVFPTPVKSNASIDTKDLAHPLIPASERIANDLRAGFEDKILLITGSNMSGKTTFLRSIGINLILAQTGSCVCASTFVFTPMKVLTSIRINDSLQEHTSYFMAELQQLQHIIQELSSGDPAIVLVDEILKGTNSEDKNYGSETFIRKLLDYNCICLFATHDLLLGSLEKTLDRKLKNYCFESSLFENELSFDYRLRRGVAKNKNASFLMQKMGIID